MELFLLLALLSIGLASNHQVRRGAVCQSSYDCSSRRLPCCRDANGRAIVLQERRIEIVENRNGTCSRILGSKGDECDDSCDCKKGYTCYRPMSGICCPPRLCYDAKWVEEQRRYWANCQPSNCSFPV